MIASFIPIFGAIISGLLGPALAYVLPMEAALVLPILSLLISMTLGFRDIGQLGLALFMFPSDFLGIWVFCKLRDRGMRFGALLVYWTILLIALVPVYVVSELFIIQLNEGIALVALPMLGIDPNATVSTALVDTIKVVSLGVVGVGLGILAWVMIKAFRRYMGGMQLLFKRLDPIRMQLKQITS